MTTLEINTSDIFAINKLKEYAKNKLNFDINILEKSDVEYKYYFGYEEDKKRVNKVYNDIETGKIKLYNEEEFKEKMDNFILNLKEKYKNN